MQNVSHQSWQLELIYLRVQTIYTQMCFATKFIHSHIDGYLRTCCGTLISNGGEWSMGIGKSINLCKTRMILINLYNNASSHDDVFSKNRATVQYQQQSANYRKSSYVFLFFLSSKNNLKKLEKTDILMTKFSINKYSYMVYMPCKRKITWQKNWTIKSNRCHSWLISTLRPARLQNFDVTKWFIHDSVLFVSALFYSHDYGTYNRKTSIRVTEIVYE